MDCRYDFHSLRRIHANTADENATRWPTRIWPCDPYCSWAGRSMLFSLRSGADSPSSRPTNERNRS
jgi:hypothetical protein